MRLVWQVPSYSFVKDVLQNPHYAGAYVWGRRQTEKRVAHGTVRKRQTAQVPAEKWKVFLRDHHEGYIDWPAFEENQRLIRNNSLKIEGDEAVAAVRAGQGLLVGLLRCGRCGRKFHVRYWGKSGTAARYLCKGDFDTGGRYCQAFGGATVDRRFSAEVLKVISPLGIQASLAAFERIRGGDEDRKKAFSRQIEQVEYEALRAFEQYNQVDPRNRLVAAELEERWNRKLEEVEKLKQLLGRLDERAPAITPAQERRIRILGERFAAGWNDENCPVELKKKILRSVIEEILVEEDASGENLRFVVHWKGGAHTRIEMARAPVPQGRKTAAQDVEIIRKMAVRYGDGEIARVLNKLGRRTGTGKRWSVQRVSRVRRQHDIVAHSRRPFDPEILTMHGAARYCQVSQTTIKRLVAAGILPKEQVVPWAPWEIRRSDLDGEPVCSIVTRLRRSGKLVLSGGGFGAQACLFPEMAQD